MQETSPKKEPKEETNDAPVLMTEGTEDLNEVPNSKPKESKSKQKESKESKESKPKDDTSKDLKDAAENKMVPPAELDIA